MDRKNTVEEELKMFHGVSPDAPLELEKHRGMNTRIDKASEFDGERQARYFKEEMDLFDKVKPDLPGPKAVPKHGGLKTQIETPTELSYNAERGKQPASIAQHRGMLTKPDSPTEFSNAERGKQPASVAQHRGMHTKPDSPTEFGDILETRQQLAEIDAKRSATHMAERDDRLETQQTYTKNWEQETRKQLSS